MFKLIGWIIKTALFAALILVIGQVIQWNGKSVSDQIKTGLSHAERAAPKNISKLSIDTDELGQKVKNAFDFSSYSFDQNKTKKESASMKRQTPFEEKIPATDKKELKALLDQAD